MSNLSMNGSHSTTSSTTRPLMATIQSSRVATSTSNSTTPSTLYSSTTATTGSNSYNSNSTTNLLSSSNGSGTLSSQQSANESTEKDNIIANDIETDKLLNEIEKSKGFSDTYSTTATRRLRNRQNPYGMASFTLNSENGDELSQFGGSRIKNGTSNFKKINRLIWNEDRQELEVLDKSLQEPKSPFSDLASNSNQSKGTSSPIVLRKQTSLTDFDEKKDYQVSL